MNTIVRLTSPPLDKGYRLVFGSPHELREVENSSTSNVDAVFLPENLFCLEVYDRFLFGNTRWALYVAQTLNSPSKATFIPNVVPGARILLEVRGKKRVTQANDWIARVAIDANPEKLHPSVFLRQHAIINTSFMVRTPKKRFFFKKHATFKENLRTAK